MSGAHCMQLRESRVIVTNCLPLPSPSTHFASPTVFKPRLASVPPAAAATVRVEATLHEALRQLDNGKWNRKRVYSTPAFASALTHSLASGRSAGSVL